MLLGAVDEAALYLLTVVSLPIESMCDWCERDGSLCSLSVCGCVGWQTDINTLSLSHQQYLSLSKRDLWRTPKVQ